MPLTQTHSCALQQFRRAAASGSTFTMASVLSLSLVHMTHLPEDNPKSGDFFHLERHLTHSMLTMADRRGNTILHHACKSDYSLARYLITVMHVDVTSLNAHRRSCLDVALIYNQVQIALICVDYIPLFTDISILVESINLAWKKQQPALVQKLLFVINAKIKHGYVTSNWYTRLSILKDDSGESVLHIAADAKLLHVINNLLSFRAAAGLVDLQDAHGRTPLHRLCHRDRNNSPHISYAVTGTSIYPLITYCVLPLDKEETELSKTTLLLAKITDLQLTDDNGLTVLDTTFKHGNYVSFISIFSVIPSNVNVWSLFTKPDDINQFNNAGETLLSAATRLNAPIHVIDQLVHMGLDSQHTLRYANTAVEVAILMNHNELVEYFAYNGHEFCVGHHNCHLYIRLLARNLNGVSLHSEHLLLEHLLQQRGIDMTYADFRRTQPGGKALLVDFLRSSDLTCLILQTALTETLLHSIANRPWSGLYEGANFIANVLALVISLGAQINKMNENGLRAIDLFYMRVIEHRSFYSRSLRLVSHLCWIFYSAGSRTVQTKRTQPLIRRAFDNLKDVTKFSSDPETIFCLRDLGMLTADTVVKHMRLSDETDLHLWVDFLQSYETDLQLLCARVIRRCLYPNAWVSAQRLPLPRLLQNYITNNHQLYLQQLTG